VPISGKVYDVLLAFLENPGRLLSKDELLHRVWADEFVEEGNLARNVSTLRKALGDTDKHHRYIATVPGHGYRFVADVISVIESVERSVKFEPEIATESAGAEQKTEAVRSIQPEEPRSRKILWALAAVIVLFTVAWFSKERLFTSSPTIKSLAVLPLRGIDPNDNYTGFGIADAVIRRLSTSGQVTVRPTSAVIHYVNLDIDTLAAARELNADAVLEGNVQRSGDRLRVSVNLLRTSDGVSLWTDSFNIRSTDLFRVQDEVSQEVADRLKIRLAANGPFELSKRHSQPASYDWYIRGLYSLDQRGFGKIELGHMLDTAEFFKRAVEADPNDPMAHAQLAFTYAWTAMFVDPDEHKWVELAQQEIGLAEKIEPNISELHVAKALLCWSGFGGNQVEEAIKELRLAKQLDPNYNGADLAALYAHAGLEQQADNEYQRVVSANPTSLALHGLKTILPYLRDDFDSWLAALPDTPLDSRPLANWYYMHKGSLDLAQKSLDAQLAESPDDIDLLFRRELLIALKGEIPRAEKEVIALFPKVQRNAENYHHRTFDIACIYALDGNSTEAVKWLRETANSGFPNYPMFAREAFLDRIRQSPEFIQFLSEQKVQWERFEQEFPDA
jgi:DNA-binding winged helix-turn-helix (wHTH) protein/TolB-like protein